MVGRMPAKEPKEHAAAKSLEWLDRAVRMGDDRDDWMRRNPHLATVREDPRFQQMLASIAYRHKQRTDSTEGK
jgi:hypothetical protein